MCLVSFVCLRAWTGPNGKGAGFGSKGGGAFGGGCPPPPTAPQTVEHPSGSHIGWRRPQWMRSPGAPPPPPRGMYGNGRTPRGEGGIPPPPPLPMFETDSQQFASAPSGPRGFTLQNVRPASGGGSIGGPWEEGGGQPNPPFPPSNTALVQGHHFVLPPRHPKGSATTEFAAPMPGTPAVGGVRPSAGPHAEGGGPPSVAGARNNRLRRPSANVGRGRSDGNGAAQAGPPGGGCTEV